MLRLFCLEIDGENNKNAGEQKTLEELSEFKKDAQQKLKALQKSLDDTTKEKDALAKELEKEKKVLKLGSMCRPVPPNNSDLDTGA